MPSRPDLRELASNVKEAFAEMDRETLLDILTFVVKEYVVEGPPPMLVSQPEGLAELAGLSFAQLIAALQTRLDHPELALFAVDGEQVSVRVGGVMQPLSARQGGAAELPRPAAGVRVVETTLQQRPPAPAPAAPAPAPRAAPPAPPATPPAAPPPARGLSIRGRPQGDAAAAPSPPPATPAQQPPQGAQPPPAQPGAVQNEKPEGSGDDASARFSLLELD